MWWFYIHFYPLSLDFSCDRCEYGGQECGAENFTTTITNFGVCFTFNSANNNESLYVESAGGEQYDLSVQIIHIHNLMIPIHCSIPTFIIKNKSSYFKKFRISSHFPVNTSSPFPHLLKLQFSHTLFTYWAPRFRAWFCLRKGITIKCPPPYS